MISVSDVISYIIAIVFGVLGMLGGIKAYHYYKIKKINKIMILNNNKSKKTSGITLTGVKIEGNNITIAEKIENQNIYNSENEYINLMNGKITKEINEQSNIFKIADMQFLFIPIISSWNKDEAEYYYGDLKCEMEIGEYVVPEDIWHHFMLKHMNNNKEILSMTEEEKVRIDNYSVKLFGGNRPHQLIFTFSKTTYRDFLICSLCLDEQSSKHEDSITFREKYFSHRSSAITDRLSNICGVGIFIITSDSKIIISKSSNNVEVNPHKYIYSASGTMNWYDEGVNPFFDIIRECQEEIGYKPDIENLKLYSFGLDYAKGYYQFSFYEYSKRTANEIIGNANMARDFYIEIEKIEALDIKYKNIINHIKTNDWDETAAANILTLVSKQYSKDIVANYINAKLKNNYYRKDIIDEWEKRSKREGRLAVLSNRYPAREIDEISENYVYKVLEFIDDNLRNKSIIEIGGGIGLFTKHFAEYGRNITCVDISQGMINRNIKYLGVDLAKKVRYVQGFFQDFEDEKEYDILVCSLVLIHNSDDIISITNNMKRIANTIYLFEQIEDGVQASRYTLPKTMKEYINYFPEYIVEKTCEYYLCLDKIGFIKLVKR